MKNSEIVLSPSPSLTTVKENLRKNKIFITFFISISSILGSIHEHLKSSGLWNSTEIVKIFGPLVELPNFIHLPSLLLKKKKDVYVLYYYKLTMPT